MPVDDFTHPTMTDGTLVDHVVTPGTLLNKSWWDNTFFPWVLGMLQSATFSSTTPADLIDQVLQGSINPPLYLESEDTHTQEASADSTRVYVRPSGYAIDLGTAQFYDGGWAELGVAGNCIVSSFSNADYYKKIAIGLAEVANVLTLKITESAEAVSEVALGEPSAYGSTWKQLGTIIVQNDGTTGVDGKILAIEQADITSMGLTIGTYTPLVPFPFKVSGTPIVGDIDVGYVAPFSGTIHSCTLLCRDTGDATGDDLLADVNIGGTSVFTGDTNKPAITKNTGTDQTDTVLAADMTTTSFTAGDIITIELETVPDNAEGISCTLWVLPPQS